MTQFSTRLLRLLLRTDPREFRERFDADLEADFEQLLRTRGRAAGWKYALSELRRAVPMTHTDDQRARRRRYAVTLGGESHMGTLTFDLRHSARRRPPRAARGVRQRGEPVSQPRGGPAA